MSTIYDEADRALAFMPFVIIGLGVAGNSLCVLIFRFNSEFKKMSSMMFLSFVAVMDTISLFQWNLNHYTTIILNYDIQFINMASCKLLPFIQYYSLQASGILLSFMTIDRFVSVRSMPGSFYSKLPFNSNKSAFYWSLGIVLTLGVLNSHILILNGYYQDPETRNRTVSNVSLPDGTFVNQTVEQFIYQNPSIICYRYKTGFRLYPTWDSIHMFIYSFIPASVMFTFNILLIVTTLWPVKDDSSAKSQKAYSKKRKLTVSLLVISFTFMFLTLPATIGWGYFSWAKTLPWGMLSLHVLDYLAFLNHTSLFFNCFITNYKFRKAVKLYARRIFCCKKTSDETITTTKTTT
jgi:hypothetical protein